MNIQPLCAGLMFMVCDLERRQRMQRMGFPTAPGFRPVKEDISGIIETQLLVPLVAELRRITGKTFSLLLVFRIDRDLQEAHIQKQRG